MIRQYDKDKNTYGQSLILAKAIKAIRVQKELDDIQSRSSKRHQSQVQVRSRPSEFSFAAQPKTTSYKRFRGPLLPTPAASTRLTEGEETAEKRKEYEHSEDSSSTTTHFRGGSESGRSRKVEDVGPIRNPVSCNEHPGSVLNFRNNFKKLLFLSFPVLMPMSRLSDEYRAVHGENIDADPVKYYFMSWEQLCTSAFREFCHVEQVGGEKFVRLKTDMAFEMLTSYYDSLSIRGK